MLAGHAHGEPALLARRGDELFAIGAVCTHYGAPLAKGLLLGETVRCQWHHACFSLRTGEALRAPALDAVSCWQVEQSDGVAFVRERLQGVRQMPRPAAPGTPASVVIVGGGAAGNAAAEMLRREQYLGLAQFPPALGPAEIDQFFTLSRSELTVVARRRGPLDRLSVGLPFSTHQGG